MAFTILPVHSSREVNQFHELPFRIYDSWPKWIPPFRFEIEKIFDRKKNPFFGYGECERFLVMDNGRVCGRFAVMTHEKKDHLYDPVMGGLGFLEMEEDPEILEAILTFARNWHRDRGRGAFRGPVNFGENDNYWGLLVENFDEPPIYGMQYHPPYYKERIEQSGAEKLDDHWSYKLYFDRPLPERLVKITDRIEQRDGVEFRPIDMKNLYRDAEYIREIYNEGWREQDI
ncbi:MAG: hypothetical protein WD315_01605, partial [Balneolaceae bacterium]